MADSQHKYIGDLMIRNLDILKADLERIPEDKLWLIYPGILNSIGNLTLHICGNLNHFIGSKIGETDYRRDRDTEFRLKNVPSAELFELIKNTRIMLELVLKQKTTQSADKTLEVAGQTLEIDEALIYLLNHQSYHIGQANYIARIIEKENK